MLAQARLEDVKREPRTQISTALDAGLSPTHLEWHCLGDGGRANIFDLGLALADEPRGAARVWLDKGRKKARGLGNPVIDGAWLESFCVDVERKSQTYERRLRSLPGGLSEWASDHSPPHPSRQHTSKEKGCRDAVSHRSLATSL